MTRPSFHEELEMMELRLLELGKFDARKPERPDQGPT